MLECRVGWIKNRRATPPRFSRIASHAFGDDDQSSGFSIPGCQLKAASCLQIKCLGHFQSHKRNSTGPKCFFRNRQNLSLIFRQSCKQVVGIEQNRGARRIDHVLPPVFPNPHDGPAGKCT